MLGQLSLEHTVLLLVGLALLLPITSQFTEQATGLASGTYKGVIESEANKLIQAIDRSVKLGENSRQTISLNLPDNFINASIEGNNTLIINVASGGSITQFIYVSKQPIIYDEVIMNLYAGQQNFYVTASDYGVCLSYDGYCGATCGNNRIDAGELCDSGIVLETCADLGYNGGSLLCNRTCSGYITDFCS